jgi:diacylglycerol kinase (ATP)
LSDPNPYKNLSGFKRIMKATDNSLNGLKQVWNEAAFRLELLVVVVLIPCAVLIAVDWVEIVLLVFPLFLILIVEIINTAIESIINRIGFEHHELSKVAKDLGSAAVFLSMLFGILVWGIRLSYTF